MSLPDFEEINNTEQEINQEIETELKYSPFWKNKKTGEVILKEKYQILDNDWIKATIEEYEKYNKEKIVVKLKIDNFLENAKIFYDKQPFFYDNSGIWWIWKQDKWVITDDVDMERYLDNELGFCGQTINSRIRNNNLRSMMWVGRENKPKDAPLKWIQFNSYAMSLKSGKKYKVTKNYFFTNPIPYDISDSEETPVIDKLFCDWVGEKNKNILYEILAYCLYRDYPIHRVFFLIGDGSNGKTSYLQIIEKFLGKDNICSTELDNLVGNNSSRFETMKMYKKLACLMGETNFTNMTKTTMLKKLSGHDLIGYEMKGKQPFDDYNYSKLIIASNSLPVTNDTTEGLWRRCLVIDFPNKFNEKVDIVKTIPEQEFNNLSRKCFNILKCLLEKRAFSDEGSIEDRKQKYIMASNPLPIFIKTFCKIEPSLYHRYSELYIEYTQWLKKNKKRIITKKEFTKYLNEEGFETRKTSKEGEIDYYIEGLQYFPDFPDSSNFPLSNSAIRGNMEIVEIRENEEKNQPKTEKITDLNTTNNKEFDKNSIIYHKCKAENCKCYECNLDSWGVPYCHNHWDW